MSKEEAYLSAVGNRCRCSDPESECYDCEVVKTSTAYIDWLKSPDKELVEALEGVLDAGDEGCCEECMIKDNIARHALSKYKGKNNE